MLSMFSPIFWLIVGIILFILEIVVPGFIFLFFGIASIFTAVIAIFIKNSIVQIFFFIGSSGVLLLFAPKLAKKVYKKKKINVGSERWIGKEAIVVKTIKPPSYGFVKLEGEEWMAYADQEIKEGEIVIVESIEGTHLHIKKKEEK